MESARAKENQTKDQGDRQCSRMKESWMKRLKRTKEMRPETRVAGVRMKFSLLLLIYCFVVFDKVASSSQSKNSLEI